MVKISIVVTIISLILFIASLTSAIIFAKTGKSVNKYLVPSLITLSVFSLLFSCITLHVALSTTKI